MKKTTEELQNLVGDKFTVERVKIVTEASFGDDPLICWIISENNKQTKEQEEVKDIWEGVEFVESNVSGKIYIKQDVNFEMLRLFKPSTESAYVDQLKKEAFKRYGEIGAIKASTDQIKALTDYSYDMNLQNMNGRENFQEAFKYGISIGIDETLSWIKFNQGNGEIKAPCTGNCGMNYCDDNGCTDRKRHLVGDPIDPQVN
jgi:hypothetical protein